MNVIVNIKGGLGNQMFCYATGYALARETGAELSLDVTMFDVNHINNRKIELNAFNIDNSIISYKYSDSKFVKKIGLNRIRKRCAIGWNTHIEKEKKEYSYDESILNIKTNVYLDGYWQTEHYFKKYREDLLKIFTPLRISHLKKLVDYICEEKSVAVHVRQGDYVGLGWSLSMDYYKTAIKILHEIDHEFIYFIFSDDIAYCKDNFAKFSSEYNIRYLEYKSENPIIDDMFLMSKCKHNIIANSSYSWWAAWLNNNSEKMVICPEVDQWKDDFYPKEWKRIQIKN